MSSSKSTGITLHVDRENWPGMPPVIVGSVHLMRFAGKVVRIFHVKGGGVDLQHAHTYLGIVKEFDFDGVGNIRGGSLKTLDIVTKPPSLVMTNRAEGGTEVELHTPCMPRLLFASTIRLSSPSDKVVGIVLHESVMRRAHTPVFRFNGVSYSCLGTPMTPKSSADVVMAETPQRGPGITRRHTLDTPTRADVRTLMAALSPFADSP